MALYTTTHLVQTTLSVVHCRTKTAQNEGRARLAIALLADQKDIILLTLKNTLNLTHTHARSQSSSNDLRVPSSSSYYQTKSDVGLGIGCNNNK